MGFLPPCSPPGVVPIGNAEWTKRNHRGFSPVHNPCLGGSSDISSFLNTVDEFVPIPNNESASIIPTIGKSDSRSTARGPGEKPPPVPCPSVRYSGSITASMMWITPLLVSMSVLITLALSTMTEPFSTRILKLLPFTVLAEVSCTTSFAVTLPATT